MATPSLVVFGGSGFLGSEVLKAAIRKGWSTTCVSRSGRPGASGTDGAWRDAVTWTRGDATDPSSYGSVLAGATHVVSCIGVLDYRGIRTAQRPSKFIDAVGSTLHDAIATRLDGGYGNAALDRYEKVNFHANRAVVSEVARHKGIKSCVYVSAAGGFPGIPTQYLSSKRNVESVMQSLSSTGGARMVWVRPGFMYAPSGPTNVLARVLGLAYALNSSLDGRISLLGAAGIKPLAVHRVGSAIVEACDDDRVHGPVEVHQLEALADVRWRAEMIV
ncbi:Putative uncharacterized protein [Taphrina deformans PYCC 5710]|uniref:NAD-dependent epimerase/dehydratase domain-containing protein n=1 Tax=Taphrina deformans (strain PYCC 5710 / ATCC 11124 / CBS 356.35 / IMI 108563 / JCM 9778 / NBRC 8474) TaxID=1097556 RepID=R4X7H6_TAPDE|nr:Putative uncharacterized protein [Taphrina deformans PYCC 5710]|eukprot:CCG81361.1 Putative uncharacterized protein [Taphrina deformans PYCC 5710]